MSASVEKFHYYLVVCPNPEGNFPVWSVKSIRSCEVPRRNGPAGSTDTRWSTAWHTGGGDSKRAALAHARKLAEKDGVPVLVEEPASVERRSKVPTLG